MTDTIKDTEVKRERKWFEVDVPDLQGFGSLPIQKIRMRILSVSEGHKASFMAQAHLDKQRKTYFPKGDGPAYDKTTEDDVFAIHKLYHACYHITLDRPAFLSPQLMMDRLSVDEAAVLKNNYDEIIRKSNEKSRLTVDDFDPEQLQSFINLCANNSQSMLPNEVLKNFNRDGVAELAVRTALRCHSLQTELKEHKALLETATAPEEISE